MRKVAHLAGPNLARHMRHVDVVTPLGCPGNQSKAMGRARTLMTHENVYCGHCMCPLCAKNQDQAARNGMGPALCHLDTSVID